MHIIHTSLSEGNPMPEPAGPQSADSIIAALQHAIDERVLAHVQADDLRARRRAILELTRLASMPESDERRARRAALIAEFGEEDIRRWSRVCR